MAKAKTKQQLALENDELRARLQELEDTLEAIRSGAVDAIVTSGPTGDHVYTLEGADHAYHTMVESMNEGAVTLLPDGMILYGNPRFVQLTGSAPTSIVGRRFHDFVHAADRQTLDEVIDRAGSNSLKAEIRLVKESSAEIPVQISASPIELSGANALTLIITDLSSQKQVEEIVAAEKLSRRILEQAQEGIVLCVDGFIVRANRALYQLCDCIPLMQPFDQIFSLRMSELQTFSVAIPQSGKTIRNEEVRYQRHDGKIFDLILSAGPILGQQDKVLGSLISLVDITERKRLEGETHRLLATAQEERDRLSALINSMNDEVWFADTDKRFSFVNPSGLKQFCFEAVNGIDVKKMAVSLEVYRPDGTPRPAEEAPPLRALNGEVVRNQAEIIRTPAENELRYREVNAAPVRDAGGNIIGSISVVRDVTERKLAEEALRQSEERFRGLFEQSYSGIVVCDFEGRILEVNPSFSGMLGYGENELVGRDVVDLTHPEDREIEHAKAVEMKEGRLEGFQLQKRYLRRDGRVIWAEIGVSALHDDRGNIVYALGMVEDITDRKRAEEALQRNEARFRLLSETAGKLLATYDPQGLVKELCTEVMEYLDCQAFFNFMVDEHAGRLRLNACAGIPEAEVRKLEWLDYGVAVCGCVARDQARIIAEDIFHTPDVRTELVKSYGIQAYCCHPLKAQNRLIGTLSFGTKTRARFTPEEVELMRIVADQVSVAMQRVQIEHDLRQSEEELQQAKISLEERVRERTMDLQNLSEQLERSRHHLRNLASELVMAEERERKRIAGVLHDEIAQTLAATRMQLDLLLGIAPDQQDQQTLKEAKALLVESIKETRALMMDVGNPVLYDMGLKAACEALTERLMERHPIRFRCDIRDAYKRLDPAVNTVLFQLIRELLNNVVKHSQAQNAHVAIDLEKGHLRVKVTDDGVGFDTRTLGAPTIEGGFGLYSIRERLIAMDGSLSIESVPGTGTVVTAVLPAALT